MIFKKKVSFFKILYNQHYIKVGFGRIPVQTSLSARPCLRTQPRDEAPGELLIE